MDCSAVLAGAEEEEEEGEGRDQKELEEEEKMPSSNRDGKGKIPASRRADGSVRKERRVRAGYTAQEEMPIYVPPWRRTVRGG